jgi:hypothetical protein
MEVEQESEEVSGALGELYIDVIRLIQKGAIVPAQKKVTVSRQKGAITPAQNGVMAQAVITHPLFLRGNQDENRD